MKIVVLNGSPRKGGNTEIMAQAFAEAARKNQNEVSILDVASMNICGCLGCKYCWAHKGECVQKDDMGKVFAALADADVVVFASPIYWFDITAQMKTVIDRLYAGGSVGFHFHKTALLLDAGADHVLELLHREGRPAMLAAHPVAGIRQIVKGVQQGAVQIEDNGFDHKKRLLFIVLEIPVPAGSHCAL